MADEQEEAVNMVKSFRMLELHSLLLSMGHSKRGVKQELVQRTLKLVQEEHSPALIRTIRQLYSARFRPPCPPTAPLLRPRPAPAPAPAAQPRGRPKQPPSPSPTAVEVKLTPLPFYQTLETLLPQTELLAQNSEKLQDTRCVFELTPSQLEQITKSRERPSSIQVVLRICYTDTSSVQDDQYPPNLAVKVNLFYSHVPGYYPSNKPGVEPRRPCRPIDITPWLKLSTATNRVTVTWGNFGKRYSLGLYLVRVVTAAELFSHMQRVAMESAERCRERIQDKLRFDPESEITTTGLCVSLICPLVKMRLGVPCRVLTCAHLQCFDAVFFLQMNEKKPTWACPVCDKPAPFELLTIDGLLSEILKETEDVEEIEYLADGSWRPIREDEKRERSSTPECPLLDSSCSVVNGHSPAHSSSSQVGVGAPAGGFVVDLTDDTLEEEEEEEGTGDSEDRESDDSEDSTPPKKSRSRSYKDLGTAF